MLFNSIDFIFFLPIVFILYWLLKSKLVLQNILIVTASYLFYGWWDWKFLILIAMSTIVDFYIGARLKKENRQKVRKSLLWISLGFNLGVLAYFKYCDFFIENFIEAFKFLGADFNIHSLNIILPVGISFYTFQTLSYSIDVYNRKLEPTDDLISFAAFVSFFPQLVAGPIERASNLLPQFYSERKFDYAKSVNGLRQILWGFVKKVVIADNCAPFVNNCFENYDTMPGSSLAVGAIFFAFQIYGDFSGYSDIAIGTSRLFGFELNRNFAFPYFSRDIAEFWRRWHISLSTWFRDYLYIPLGGSKGGRWMKVRNTFIIFLVSGFWHGANWTFVFWGFLNALFFVPLLLVGKNRVYTKNIVAYNKYLPTVKEFFQIMSTFLLVTFAWVFFRAADMTEAVNYIYKMLSNIAETPVVMKNREVTFVMILLIGFIAVEWVGRKFEFALDFVSLVQSKTIRWIIYGLTIFFLGMFMQTSETPFIYFQF